MKKSSLALMVSFSAALCLTTTFISYAKADTLIVAAKNASFTAINAKVALKLWLGKKKRLNGKKVVIVDQQDDSPAQTEFYQKILKKSSSEMKAYWAKLVFMGNSFPPRKLANDSKVKLWLAAHPNNIGYIDANALDDTVQILLAIK
jgi:hypoxanthine phosphoribosyltransferase